MFTGLIEKLGEIERCEPRGSGAALFIRHAPWDSPPVDGESIAVQGVCVTATAVSGGVFACDVLQETLERSTLGGLRPGAAVNLERALRVGDRLGGHFVSGHVDGCGEVRAVTREGEDWVLSVRCRAALLDGIVEKGSVAVDGVSLTVTEVTETAFAVKVIPYTWSHTSLSGLGPRSAVNLELDMLGKYVKRYLGRQAAESTGMTEEDLRQAGF